jgi:hypothetical protein
MTEAKKLSARERRELAVEKQADAILSDQKYARLRTPRARVALVVLMAAIIVVTPVAWVLGGSIAGIALVIVSFVAWGALRTSVRVIADLPDTVLDERQVALRNAVYLDAYRWFAGLVLLAATIGLIGMIFAGNEFSNITLTITWEAAMATFWVLEMCALALPSMVLALRDRELPN